MSAPIQRKTTERGKSVRRRPVCPCIVSLSLGSQFASGSFASSRQAASLQNASLPFYRFLSVCSMQTRKRIQGWQWCCRCSTQILPAKHASLDCMGGPWQRVILAHIAFSGPTELHQKLEATPSSAGSPCKSAGCCQILRELCLKHFHFF